MRNPLRQAGSRFARLPGDGIGTPSLLFASLRTLWAERLNRKGQALLENAQTHAGYEVVGSRSCGTDPATALRCTLSSGTDQAARAPSGSRRCGLRQSQVGLGAGLRAVASSAGAEPRSPLQ